MDVQNAVWGNRCSPLVLRPFDVAAVGGHDHDLGAGRDERRHHGAHAVRECRRLIGGGRRLAFDRGLGFDHFEHRFGRQLDRHRNALVHGDGHLHLGVQIGGLIADEVGLERDLVVALHIHKVEAFAVLVHELVLAVLDEGALDLIGGFEPQREFYAVGNAADIHLGHRRALAGMDVLGVDDDPELAVDFDDIAFTQRTGDDSHGYLNVFGLESGRTIPIFRLTASYFLLTPRTRTWRTRIWRTPVPHRFGTQKSMPTAGRRYWRGAASLARCGPGLRLRILSRSRPARFRSRPATRCIFTPLPRHLWRPTARGRRYTCAPRRNSLARNCSPQANAASSNSQKCSATASAARCMRRNSRWSNGIARVSHTR